MSTGSPIGYVLTDGQLRWSSISSNEFAELYIYIYIYTHTHARKHARAHTHTERERERERGYTQKNGAVSKVNKKFISHLTRAQLTPSAATTVQVSHALPAVLFSCLMRGRGACFQDGVAAGKGFLCAPF